MTGRQYTVRLENICCKGKDRKRNGRGKHSGVFPCPLLFLILVILSRRYSHAFQRDNPVEEPVKFFLLFWGEHLQQLPFIFQNNILEYMTHFPAFFCEQDPFFSAVLRSAHTADKAAPFQSMHQAGHG